ncbi:polysaccharide deacetylase family protein [Phenylobacterium sp. J367]|uniref:polysaccharide deacetylase family protein n=1 Tax=Phenylobacterium sp. J367 TaxID=2898435 RepID=UPI002151EEE0|nr:polysaccharide deacetylase family protein [Phenylobacterium sp. J367]MCR5878733.1 polysaccharide deacetylase family protein [Phenylobacterium sp. J367]
MTAEPEPVKSARRRSPPLWLILLALVAIVAGGLWQISNLRCFALLGPLMCKVETTRPEVALTFDDGPTARGLDAVLPVLRASGVRATFFIIGQEAEARPELVKRLVDAGHEVANHSWSHQRMVLRSQGFYERELSDTETLLDQFREREVVGGWFRPPYGKKLPGLALAAQREGLTMVTWDVEEPSATDPAEYAREIVEQAKPGSIILMHVMYDANGTARAALPLVLQGLAAKGLAVTTVGRLADNARAEKEAEAERER